MGYSELAAQLNKKIEALSDNDFTKHKVKMLVFDAFIEMTHLQTSEIIKKLDPNYGK